MAITTSSSTSVKAELRFTPPVTLVRLNIKNVFISWSPKKFRFETESIRHGLMRNPPSVDDTQYNSGS